MKFLDSLFKKKETPVVNLEIPNPVEAEEKPLSDRELLEQMAMEISALREEIFWNRMVFVVCLLVLSVYSWAKFSEVKAIISALVMVFME